MWGDFLITAEKFVEQARTGNYLGIPYKQLDCQAFVEKVLKDCGLSLDWRGSNHMWREALSEKHKITDAAEVPAGAWLFTIKNDGGEKQRGYNDNEGNAAHVGIYLGDTEIIHSTTGGVQMDVITSKRWTHYGLCKYIDFSGAADLREIVRQLGGVTIYQLYQAIRQEWG